MLHLPVLRSGVEYESLELDELVGYRGGEPLARVSRVNAGIIRRDLTHMAQKAGNLNATWPGPNPVELNFPGEDELQVIVTGVNDPRVSFPLIPCARQWLAELLLLGSYFSIDQFSQVICLLHFFGYSCPYLVSWPWFIRQVNASLV